MVIPLELKERVQWVLWRSELRDGKSTKVPYTPMGRRASSTDPTTWSSFEEVERVARRFDGLGFVFSAADPYVGLDFDNCFTEEGDLHPEARRLIDRLDSYTEVSPSGKGVHVIIKAKLNGHRNRTSTTPWGGSFECYGHSRFFTITGKKIG